jgi:hypothetical protein
LTKTNEDSLADVLLGAVKAVDAELAEAQRANPPADAQSLHVLRNLRTHLEASLAALSSTKLKDGDPETDPDVGPRFGR